MPNRKLSKDEREVAALCRGLFPPRVSALNEQVRAIKKHMACLLLDIRESRGKAAKGGRTWTDFLRAEVSCIKEFTNLAHEIISPTEMDNAQKTQYVYKATVGKDGSIHTRPVEDEKGLKELEDNYR